jgi:iron donor protein CyaY
MPLLEERDYRHLLDDTLAHIDRAFDDVDPDLAESTLSQGALTITFSGGARLILSPQPSPRQLWVAFRDRAWHFDWDAQGRRWIDDRGQGIEALSLVRDLARETAGVDLKLG